MARPRWQSEHSDTLKKNDARRQDRLGVVKVRLET